MMSRIMGWLADAFEFLFVGTPIGFIGVLVAGIFGILAIVNNSEAANRAQCAPICAPLRVSDTGTDFCFCHVPDEVRPRRKP